MAACAQTTITDGSSFIDPGWNRVPAQSVLVEVVDAPLGERQAIEDSIVKGLRENKLIAGQSYKLLLPTREYSDAQRMDILNDAGYETHLIIRPYNHDMVTYSVPPVTEPFGTATYGSGGRGSVGFGINFSNGYRKDEPIISYRSDLHVLKDDHKIWTGDYATCGVDGMSYETVGKRFAKELIEKMKSDGVI